MKIKYPKVKQDREQRVYIDFNYDSKRYRLYNGKKINSEIHPNAYPVNQRLEMGHLLAAEVYKFMCSGMSLELLKKSRLIKPLMTDKDYLKAALDLKLRGNYSEKYKDKLEYVFNAVTNKNQATKITSLNIKHILDKYTSGVTYNTMRRHLNALFNEAVSLGMTSNPMLEIKSKKTKAKLHKPFDNLAEVLDEIKHYNSNLYLCCLLTYGCLLRPHREVRELTWGDFSEDLSFINLSGHRNKSGKNRIVPVPSFIKDLLDAKDKHLNIFTGRITPPNKDYFKTLWGRYKKTSKVLKQDQTLYSFRHSGAINIFKRTGSITKLQKAMGHSNITVSLTYLRGLEIAELKEADMPSL
jgi:integrase